MIIAKFHMIFLCCLVKRGLHIAVHECNPFSQRRQMMVDKRTRMLYLFNSALICGRSLVLDLFEISFIIEACHSVVIRGPNTMIICNFLRLTFWQLREHNVMKWRNDHKFVMHVRILIRNFGHRLTVGRNPFLAAQNSKNLKLKNIKIMKVPVFNII